VFEGHDFIGVGIGKSGPAAGFSSHHRPRFRDDQCREDDRVVGPTAWHRANRIYGLSG